MHEFDAARQQFVNAVAHDGVGLAATDLHQHPGPGCRLDNLSRQGPCNAMVTVLVKIFHKPNPSGNPTGMTLSEANRLSVMEITRWCDPEPESEPEPGCRPEIGKVRHRRHLLAGQYERSVRRKARQAWSVVRPRIRLPLAAIPLPE